jgi:hypothetical protein
VPVTCSCRDEESAFGFEEPLVAVRSVAVGDVAGHRDAERLPVRVVAVLDDELADCFRLGSEGGPAGPPSCRSAVAKGDRIGDHHAMPDGDEARAMTSAQARAARALAQEAALAKIASRLCALGIRPLLIKGPVIARLRGPGFAVADSLRSHGHHGGCLVR